MDNKKTITIIGGGVNGICTAYYLMKEGLKIQIIDPAFSNDGTSYGNAGMIVPSHFIPMASPGIISKGLKMMFDSSSPFYIKPRLDLQLAQWLWRFNQSCNNRNVERSQELIWNYNEMSKKAYREIAESEDIHFDFNEVGLLMLYKTEKSRDEEVEIAEHASKLGVQAKVLDQSQVQKLNPDTKVDVLGGVYYPGDAHLYSNHFMKGIISLLEVNGVHFIKDKVIGGRLVNKSLKSVTLEKGGVLPIEELVVTAGAWSGELLRKIGVKLLVEDGKGYSITQSNIDLKPTIPSILTDEKVAITPMGNDLRITGTLEISGRSAKINEKRVRGFLNAVPKYFPEIQTPSDLSKVNIWTGYRPLSFDGVPYVGRSEKIENLIVGTGHGMMGMSLGPATGKLISQIITNKSPELEMSLMSLER